MKHIFLNLKRFDIPRSLGGVNDIAALDAWGGYIVSQTQNHLKKYTGEAEFTMFFPEAHVPGAVCSRETDSPIQIGCQGVYREDTAVGGPFGAFTSNRTANAMQALGASSVLIGHCEERKSLLGVLAEAGVTGTIAAEAVNRILNKEVRAALAAGLSVLYCVGENTEEQPCWKEVLRSQTETGLAQCKESAAKLAIAYEPVWAIGPGKTPPNRDYIEMIAHFLKEITDGLPIVYGGGLKADNAAMLASIPEIDGGLIALTRFSGKIGFYPEEYLEIVKTYLGH